MLPSVNRETSASVPAPPWVPVLAIVLATAAVYGGTLAGPLIYDDHLWITWNPSIRHLWPVADVLFPPADSVAYGRPVLSLTLALNYAMSGNGAWSYRLTNIAIHILAALALFGIARRTLALRPDLVPGERDRDLLSFAAALLWAVHPLQTESVTYVIQRAESLMGLLYLVTLYCFIRSVQAPGANSRAWRMLSVLACLLGMATKEVMVTAPLVVLAYDRTFVAGGFREAIRRRWRLYFCLACTWLAPAFLAAGLHGRGVGFGLGYSWWAYALTEGWVVAHYVLLAVWPHPLVLDYGTDVVGSLGETIPWALALAALAGAAWAAFRRRTLLGFAGAWFFVILAPASSLVPVAFQPMAEHRMYLPLAAVVALVVAAAWALLGRRSLPVLLAAAVALGIGARLRNRDYRSDSSIWADTVLRRPGNPRARVALGSALALEDRNAEAAEQFKAALNLDPGNFEGRRNLGLAYFHMGRVEEALAQYRIAAAHRSAPLHYDIGMALDREGRLGEAIKEYGEAVRLDPRDGEAHNLLGSALFRSGRVGEAVAQYQLAILFKPDAARMHYNLAMALDLAGLNEQAIAEYRAAVRLEAGYAEAHNNLGSALAQAGRIPEAIAEYEEALRIRPGYEKARSNLELLKAGAGAR
jgi:tetratricopeptide (TPR) repeat protein